ncbi:MAG TPA: ABC transporter ATP-binding protein [Clostridia bacterium]|nr:MAG: High-affinity branched-chain amino acid transport ATP-binding protein LivF [Firmicutes bacterium ADurb.Bin248]HOG01204.1 ABC transporter ATP-binding protein [Clostridia bacterium]HOS18882.1 ABC transporter ATP-binding protein [Clostridia bacterium]HPK15088.1 ABC transporter ATP-binding protein [Clostridia bacterium]
MSALLQVDSIEVFYGRIRAVKGVSFEVREGEIVSLIGANGAGKSTILKTVSGLIRPKTGKIEFLGQDITKAEPHAIVRRGIAHVPEGRRVFARMSVMENIEMGAYVHGKAAEEELENAFARFPRLRERRRQLAGTLSGGEQQMLAMARALMSKPALMMMDEPSMGLSPILVEQIFDIISELRAAGTTILLVEQNANKALRITDRTYVLETGRVTLSGESRTLLESDEVKRAYLGGKG